MPAPKNPNTAAATAAVRRKGQETMAAKLRAAGWTVVPPDGTDNTPKSSTAGPDCGHNADFGATPSDEETHALNHWNRGVVRPGCRYCEAQAPRP